MKKINTFTLKMIALIAMVCDHIGYTFFPEVVILRIIGRISFPIFAYVLVEGFLYTKDVKKYLIRLSALALLSEIPFDIMVSKQVLEFEQQNVFFTLFLGTFTLYLISRTVNPTLQLSYVGITMVMTYLFRTDYSLFGILIIILFYYLRESKWIKWISFVIISLLFNGVDGCFISFALLPMILYNGKQGPKWKWFFYIFYPVHALIIGLINIII